MPFVVPNPAQVGVGSAGSCPAGPLPRRQLAHQPSTLGASAAKLGAPRGPTCWGTPCCDPRQAWHQASCLGSPRSLHSSWGKTQNSAPVGVLGGQRAGREGVLPTPPPCTTSPISSLCGGAPWSPTCRVQPGASLGPGLSPTFQASRLSPLDTWQPPAPPRALSPASHVSPRPDAPSPLLPPQLPPGAPAPHGRPALPSVVFRAWSPPAS